MLFFPILSPVFANGTPAVTIKVPRPSNLQIEDIGKFISAVIGLILIVAALFAFVYLIWGGIQWITSGGDKSGVEAAQKKIQAAIIGLFIVFAVWALFSVVGGFLGFSLTGLELPKAF